MPMKHDKNSIAQIAGLLKYDKDKSWKAEMEIILTSPSCLVGEISFVIIESLV